MPETRRQQLITLLSQSVDYTLDELAEALSTKRKLIEDDLEHVIRSGKHTGLTLRAKPAKCLACGFVFEGREAKHLHAPSRCPKCKSEHLEDPAFRLISEGSG